MTGRATSTTTDNMTTASPTTRFVEFFLTCKSWQEAQKIVDHLLDRSLIGSAEFIPIQNEVKLIMESAEHLYDEAKDEIAKLHSYEGFILHSVPIEKLSAVAAGWSAERADA